MKFNNLSVIRTERRLDAEAQINLAQRRAWFADEDSEQGDGNKPGQGGANGMTPIESLPADVQEYIRSLRDEAATSRKTLKEKLDAVAAAQQDELKKKGNFETLAEQRAAEVEALKPYKERTEALETIIRSSNEERIKTIPDNKKPLVKVLVGKLSPEDMQQYLNENPSLFVTEPPPNYDAGVVVGGSGGGKGEPKVTDEDRRQAAIAQANGHNVKPEDIAKRRVEMTKTAASGDK